jgi:glycosyltransferase involved in cell wall biosynthesis
MTAPSVAVVVPCHNEAGYIDVLLESLLPQVEAAPTWRIVLVDDASSDTTPLLVAEAARRSERVHAVSGGFGAPGSARSAGVAAAEAWVPDWIITVDADVTVSPSWLAEWEATLTRYNDDEAVGAINGQEDQSHLFDSLPNARQVSAAFGSTLVQSEALVGITNLNGVNHAVRLAAYRTAGPYVQPTAPGPDGIESLAGEDWDLGVRLRRAGFRIEQTKATVHDRGRRLLADVHAYVSGEAYEGAFRRLASRAPSSDLDSSEVASLVEGAINRSLRHFFLKPILAETVSLDASTGLSETTLAAMAAWMIRWPHPTFEESRNGFIFGRLARFSDAFVAAVRNDLGLVPSL